MSSPGTAPELRDSPDELAALAATPALQWALDALGTELEPPFRAADRLAIRHQRSYRRITWWATTFGTISLLLSIGGLLVDVLRADELVEPVLVAQIVTLAITAAAVLRGLFAYRHENWLLERCRAEQLRALKFTHLLDTAWCTTDGDARHAWRERVRADIERVRALQHEDIASIAAREDVPGLLATAVLPDAASLEALAGYYDRKRLSPQREYFLRASSERGHHGSRALPLFFFGAVFLEVLQAVLAVTAGSSGIVSIKVVGTWLAAAAIALPAVWAGIRTQQGAREVARNATRSRARHGALTQLTERLLAARGNPAEVLWTMHLAEFVLQVDQREWLRLLRDAEWYG